MPPAPRARSGRALVVAVVANYGAPGVALTRSVVADLARQDVAADLQVVVVDDGSGASVAAALGEGLAPGAELLALTENRGYAAACNAGISLAIDRGAEYVWLLNNDLEVPEGTLARLVATIAGRPMCAAVAPATVAADAPGTVLGAGVRLSMSRARVRHLFEGRPVTDLPAAPYDVDAVEGAAPLVRIEALRATGLLDESYRMYWEDTDWSVRAKAAGWSLTVDPGARVGHRVAQSTTSLQRTEFMLVNRVRFSDRNGTSADRLFFRAYFVFGWLPLYAVARLLPKHGARTTGWLVRRVLRRALTARCRQTGCDRGSHRASVCGPRRG